LRQQGIGVERDWSNQLIKLRRTARCAAATLRSHGHIERWQRKREGGKPTAAAQCYSHARFPHPYCCLGAAFLFG
jgi:hypothetical protein